MSGRILARQNLKTAPQSAIQLLHAFGRPGGAGERSTLGDIDQDRYQALVLFVDANEIAAVLQREFETIRESVTPENAYEQTGDARLAARFIVLHRALGGTDTVTA